MRQSPLAIAMLAVLHLLALGSATPTLAATFDAQVDASQSAVNGSHNTSDADQDTVSTSPANASLTFSGSSSAFSLPQRTGSTTASGSARSQFDANFLELGVFATSKASGVSDGGQFDYRSTCNASASFLDAITVTGGATGEIGYIHVIFALDGTLTSSATSGLNESVSNLLIMASDSIGGFQNLSLSSTDGVPAAIPPTIDFYMKYRFDQEAPFSMSMFAQTFGYLASTASNVTQKADFKNTLRFVTAEILDFNFVPVQCADIVSSSGLVYPFGPLDHIILTPADATTGAGVPQVYSVKGVDSNCHDLGDISAISTLTITPDGSCTGTSCTATVLGVHTVTVHAAGKTAFTSLTIVPGPLHHLVLSPANATITAGNSQAYTAEGFDAFNNSRGDVTADTTFTVSPNGSCAGASCSPTIAGAHTVTGTDSGKTGSTGLTVNPGPLDHITISPASVTTSIGGSQTYTAQGFDAFNNSLGDVTGATAFSIAPDGSCLGATCTASVVGPHTVTGDDGGLQDTASFNVIPGPPRPDLVVTAVDNGSAPIRFFGRISAHDTIKNQGAAPSKFSLTRYYLSTNQTKDGGDKILLGLRFVGPLAPGQSSSGGENLFVFGAAPGTYYLLACADDLSKNTESDESNNCLASPTQIVVQ